MIGQADCRFTESLSMLRGDPFQIKTNSPLQIILPCINVCTELSAENRFRLD